MSFYTVSGAPPIKEAKVDEDISIESEAKVIRVILAIIIIFGAFRKAS